MPSLKSIRKRIVSVKNTQKITKAMKMVAAAKLRRAQEGVQAIRPYAKRMKKVAQDLADLVSEDLKGGEDDAQAMGDLLPILRGRPGQREQKLRLVAVTSDRGLAGAFNSNVNRRAERFLVEHKDAAVEMVVLGKKGRDYLRRRNLRIVKELAGPEPKSAARLAQELAADLTAALTSGEADAVYVIYNEFKNASTQRVALERLLPLREAAAAPPPGTPPVESDEPKTLIDFVYEPSQQEVLLHLVPLYIESELRRILLESVASEFGARMSAMDNASRNAKEMISRLSLQYNRARQASITKELMEIVGGAEALKG